MLIEYEFFRSDGTITLWDRDEINIDSYNPVDIDYIIENMYYEKAYKCRVVMTQYDRFTDVDEIIFDEVYTIDDFTCEGCKELDVGYQTDLGYYCLECYNELTSKWRQ